LTTASRPPQLDVEKVKASAVIGSISRQSWCAPRSFGRPSTPASTALIRVAEFFALRHRRPGWRSRVSIGLPPCHHHAAVPVATSCVPFSIGSASLPRVHSSLQTNQRATQNTLAGLDGGIVPAVGGSH
jgi:hypothetical protein